MKPEIGEFIETYLQFLGETDLVKKRALRDKARKWVVTSTTIAVTDLPYPELVWRKRPNADRNIWMWWESVVERRTRISISKEIGLSVQSVCNNVFSQNYLIGKRVPSFNFYRGSLADMRDAWNGQFTLEWLRENCQARDLVEVS